MAAVKSNPNYKPDEVDAIMFLNEQKKCGMAADLTGFGILLKMEYPALTDKEVYQLLKAWVKDSDIEHRTKKNIK